MSESPLRRLVGRLTPFRWPFAALVAGLLLALVAFVPGFFGKVLARLGNEDWWADNILVFIVFSGLTTWLVSLAQRDADRRWRSHFEGWRMEMVDGATVLDSTFLHWEDADKYLNSEFERWRAIKGFMSTLYNVKSSSIMAARGQWLDDPMHRLAEASGSSDGWLEPPDNWTDRTIRIRIDALREGVDVHSRSPAGAP